MGRPKIFKGPTAVKTVEIPRYQADWLEDHNGINFSYEVRIMIDNLMRMRGDEKFIPIKPSKN